ncbi:LysR family transcriptional regulator [Pectobacterium actinidiae]|uniref:LysR family transcriptional regulator n=1 Tax=Pectobacterium actinidiae TaxID=1507808 RepID=A0A1V2QYE6_9GAMM|nr:LysR family transcriptional regulator [Pectobacterium actinidiae]KHN91390.1 LysR family transcriptional regulator [Pectobacterium actinidiae]ONK01067.1 LysR family transcriptional regulator [Pectobacterium actinidiae]ONK01263.1 LysR family transcriptional regulator [Pectobacterium actinidiae]WEF13565.1 LysR family transcriptional regulator [Pectobacterium actinidiae]
MEPYLLPQLALFAEIARHKSFTRAAAELKVSRAAISHSLKTLEQRLNVRLLNRTTRDMSLTDEGLHLLRALEPALGSIERAIREIGNSRNHPSGLLRVNTSRSAAKMLIEPHLAEFLVRYPDLQLELVMDDGLANIIADGCDAGIRLGESLAEHVVAVPVTQMLEMVVAGSPSYFAKNAIPKTLADLAEHNCISYRRLTSGAVYDWEFSAEGDAHHQITVEPKGTFITNDDEGMINAALQGVGLIQHINLCLHRHLEEGSLVRVLDEWCPPFPGFYLYVPTRENMPARVRAFMDFLIEKRDAFQG